MKTISVPLILVNLQDNGFHILVEIVVFGEKLFAVVDTGASRSVFHKELLEKHVEDLQENEEQQAATIFSSATTLVGIIPLLQIGKLKLPNYETVAIDLQSVSDTYLQMGQSAIAGIIGGDILVTYNCKIDYQKKVLRFYISQ
ncbi:aspartyl protease family protein [Pedobacter sp.]